MTTCACGCGSETTIAKLTNRRLGHIAGEHVRYIRGHHMRVMARNRPAVVGVPCACGCGEITRVRKRTPNRFVRGHAARGTTRTPEHLAALAIGRTAANRRRVGQKHSPERCRKIGLALKGKMAFDKHPHWKGGVSFHVKSGNRLHAEWAKAVKTRDGYTCSECGLSATGKIMHAHHVEGWNDRPDLRYDVANGLTLCNDCHQRRHVRPPAPPHQTSGTARC